MDNGPIPCVLLLIFHLTTLSLPAQTPDTVRTCEDAQYQTIIERLDAMNVPFQTQSLLEKHGAFGTSIYVSIPSYANEVHAGTFVLAVPISFSDMDKLMSQTGIASRTDAALPYHAEVALAFIAVTRRRVVPINVFVVFLGDA